MRMRFRWLLWLLAGVVRLTSPHAGEALVRPNVVLIIADDHAWPDYGFMGHPVVRTPNLDRLSAEGVTYPRGYVPSSLCCPSLASIITGRFPHQHKITCNDPPLPKGMPRAAAYRSPAFRQGRDQLSAYLEATETLPRILGRQGYASFQAGKWWQGNHRSGGFTDGMTAGDPDRGGRHGDDGLKIGRETMQPIYHFIERSVGDGKPFFVWYAPMMPHDPHTPPERFLAKYRDQTPSIHQARYWAMVEWFDETCGNLLAYLDAHGLTRNTIVAYVADNGWIQDPASSRFAPKSKQSPYDGGLRTPIMIRWPGRIAPRRSSALASSIDLMPTLLKATGVQAPADLPGIDLLDPSLVNGRERIFGECFTHDAIDLNDPARNLRWRWCIEGTWKIIVPHLVNEPGAAVELYDLATDPLERLNLASDQSERVTALHRRVDDWWGWPGPAGR